tara:strand:- start:227 stop:1204 length:978 start_codon:yes stop_codon:yes gene_type:complete
MRNKLFTNPPPNIDPLTIKRHLKVHYDVEGKIAFYPSDRDQIILIEANNNKYILKVYNFFEDLHNVQLQIKALNHILCSNFPFEIPIPIQGLKFIEHLDKKYNSCMFSFIDGSLLHEFDGNTKHLKKMGQLIGSLSKALCDFKHHGRSNNFPWDIQNINFLKNKIKHIKNIEDAQILKDFILKYETNVIPVITKIRKSFVHNDGNNNNIILNSKSEVKGIIDFGDMTRSLTVCEPAVCISYIGQNSENPLESIKEFLNGYLSIYDLNKYESNCIPYLVCIRLSISVTMAAWRKKLFPNNKYLTISEKPAWAFIHFLKKIELQNWI